MNEREGSDARGWLFDAEGEPSAEEREVMDSLRAARWKGDVEALMRRVEADGVDVPGAAALAGKPPVAQGEPPVAPRRALSRRRLGMALLAAAAVLVAVNTWAYFARASAGGESAWKRAAGGSWAVGEWVETGRAETVEAASDIGRVTVGPGSRARLLRAAKDEHRIELAQGSIEAFIYAPPRLFFVDTPAVTAVDMGCAYKLAVEPDGSGTLRVTGGWVELQGDQGISRVPAGAVCAIAEGGKLGIPRFEDASAELAASVAGFESGREGAIAGVLAAARGRDSLTVWHLLARTEGAERGRVAERLAALAPVEDAGVKSGALALEPAALEAWWSEVRRSW